MEKRKDQIRRKQAETKRNIKGEERNPNILHFGYLKKRGSKRKRKES